MKRFVYLVITLVTLSLAPAMAESPAGASTVSGTVRVEKGLTGTVESVELVNPAGEAIRVEGPALDVLSTLEGKQVQVEGVVVTTSEGTRTVTASAYKIL